MASDREQSTVNYFKDCKKNAEDVLCRRYKQIEELWDFYQMKIDFSDKEDWQSRFVSSRIYQHIEQAGAIIKRALVRPDRLFDLRMPPDISYSENADLYALFLAQEENRFKYRLSRSNFAQMMTMSTKEALLTGVSWIKVLYEDGLLFEPINTLNIFADPNYDPFMPGNPRYIIEKKLIELPELKRLARRVNESAKEQIYNIAAINRIEEDYTNAEEMQKIARMLGYEDIQDKNVKWVLLYECYGDIPNDDGDKYSKENQLVVIANEKDIIRQQDNPCDDGSYPYIPDIPVPYPHRGVIGNSMVEPEVKIFFTYSQLINMMVDNMNYSVNKMFVLDEQQVLNPDKIRAMYPGKIIRVSRTGNVANAMREVPVNGVGADAFNLAALLEQESQKATGISDILVGSPTTNAPRKTATEQQLASSAAQGIFQSVVKNVEMSIQQVLRKSYNLLVQFEDFRPMEFDIEVGGVSLALSQQEMVEKTERIISDLAAIGGMPSPTAQNPMQTVSDTVNLDKVWKKRISAIGMEDVLNTPQEIQRNQQIRAAMMQQQQQAQQAAIDAEQAAEAEKMALESDLKKDENDAKVQSKLEADIIMNRVENGDDSGNSAQGKEDTQ